MIDGEREIECTICGKKHIVRDTYGNKRIRGSVIKFACGEEFHTPDEKYEGLSLSFTQLRIILGIWFLAIIMIIIWIVMSLI